MDGCMNGFNIVRHDPSDELMIMSDFQSNVNLVVNGETLTQSQLVERLYYNDNGFDRMRNNEFVANRNSLINKKHEIPDEPKPLEPGQVDPAAFFGSSLKGLF